MKTIKPVSYVLIGAMVFALTFSACESDPDAMDLPPKESLVMDLDIFPSGSKKAAEPFLSNWAYSSLNVFLWSALATVHTVVPGIAYAEAFNHTPVYMGDNTWEWSYSVPIEGDTYVTRLTGKRLNNEEFSMVMTLSKTTGTDQFEDFTWFEGVIRYDHTAATWTVAYDAMNPKDYLEIKYTKDFVTDEGTLRYTIIDNTNEAYESYIEYGRVPGEDFDAYFTINYNDTITNIEWNTTTDAGRVMNEIDFGDTNWHCWDSQLQDVDCSTGMSDTF